MISDPDGPPREKTLIEKNAEIIEERIAFGDATIERALKGEMPLYSKDDKTEKKIWIEWADG